MPTIFSHAIFATAIGKVYTSEPLPLRFWLLTAICSMLPDADVVGFIFHIKYGSMFGHRGITHSIAFALLVGIIVGMCCFKQTQISRSKLILYFSLVTLSHPLLDMLTNGGLGVALFAPFSGERYFFPWRPIEVSPIGVRFFSARGLDVFMSEVLWIWLPSVLLIAEMWIVRRLMWRLNNN
jgi:inner membrane protein